MRTRPVYIGSEDDELAAILRATFQGEADRDTAERALTYILWQLCGVFSQDGDEGRRSVGLDLLDAMGVTQLPNSADITHSMLSTPTWSVHETDE